MPADKQLAQANLAIARYPMDDAAMASFVERLDEINALAESSNGFVWRMQGEEMDAEAQAVFDEPRALFNLTVWQDLECLQNYVYRSAHGDVLRQRSQWFEKPARAPFVLWWIDAGHLPTITEAHERFVKLWEDGPGESAFTFRQSY